MSEELVHAIYIGINDAIAEYLNSVYAQITPHFYEKRNFDWHYHLNILSKLVLTHDSEKFFSQIKKEFQNDTSWQLNFTGFSVRESGYVFFEPDDASKEEIHTLHQRALTATDATGYEGYTIGRPIHHPFDPHLSLIKLDPTDAMKVPGLLTNTRCEMQVDRYMLGMQVIDPDGRNGIANIGEIKL